HYRNRSPDQLTEEEVPSSPCCIPGRTGSAHSTLMRARRNSPEPRNALSIPTERGFGGKPPKKSEFRRHLAGSKMPKETFFTAISRWRVVKARSDRRVQTRFRRLFSAAVSLTIAHRADNFEHHPPARHLDRGDRPEPDAPVVDRRLSDPAGRNALAK